jgi:hypothetical protein
MLSRRKLLEALDSLEFRGFCSGAVNFRILPPQPNFLCRIAAKVAPADLIFGEFEVFLWRNFASG